MEPASRGYDLLGSARAPRIAAAAAVQVHVREEERFDVPVRILSRASSFLLHTVQSCLINLILFLWMMDGWVDGATSSRPPTAQLCRTHSGRSPRAATYHCSVHARARVLTPFPSASRAAGLPHL